MAHQLDKNELTRSVTGGVLVSVASVAGLFDAAHHLAG